MKYIRNYRFILAVLAVCFSVCLLPSFSVKAAENTSVPEGSYIAPNGQTYLYYYEFTTTEKATTMQDWTWKTWSNYPLVIVHDTGSPSSLHQLHYLDPETGEVECPSDLSFYRARYKPDGILYDQSSGAWCPYHYSAYPSYDFEGRIFCTNPYPEFDTVAEAKTYLEKLSHPEPEEQYSEDLGYLTGMDRNISITNYLEGHIGDYVDNTNSQEISFSWNMSTSSGLSLYRNDYTDLKVRITPKAKVSFTSLRGSSMGSFENTFIPVEVSPSKLSYSWESGELLDFIESVQPSSATSFDVVLTFDVQLMGSGLGFTHVGDVAHLSISYPGGFWGNKARYIVSGEGSTSPYGQGLYRDLMITVYDNREDRVDDIPEIQHTGFGNLDLTDIDLTGFVSTVNSTIEYILVIPQVIGSLFSFLPNWVVANYSLCFGLLAVLIVVKFIRG